MVDKSNHGYDQYLYRSSIYRSWTGMKTRCLNPKATRYERWGGRGIKVCEKWMTFSGFLEDMGMSYRKGLSLDRIDNNGDYEPGNCVWSTPRDQANNRRSNFIVTIGEEKKTLEEWIRFYNQKSSTVRRRYYDLGWDIVKAITFKRENYG